MNQHSPACLAVIPARGGSKRVPGKNIRPLGDRPALAYTIAAALASGLFARVVVNTDCPTIAAVALHYGAEVPFLRDPALADDQTHAYVVTVDTLARLDPTGQFAAVAQLMANCPLRTADDVRASYAQFVATQAQAQLSVTRYGWQNPWWAMQRDERYTLQPLFAAQATQRSQDLPELFCVSGAIWWAQAAVLRAQQTFHIPQRTGWEIPWQRAVDIDTEDDWVMAETLLDRAQRAPR